MDNAKQKRKKPKKLFTEHKCDICKKAFGDKWLLRSHEQSHSTATPHACAFCSYAGKTAKLLGAHIKKVHTEPTIGCDVCGKMFHFTCKMRKHMLVHSGEKPYKCKVCSKAFNSAYSLKTHNLIHKDLKPYECRMCDYACRDSSSLRKHEDRHLGKKTVFPCKLCNKECRSRRDLKLHMDEKHLGLNVNRIPCGICGKMFRTNSHLATHVNCVHARRYSCQCEICGVEISNRYNLLTHMRSHIDIKPYRCTYEECGKTFKSMEYLKKHSVIHFPERQYPCDVCGKHFARKMRLQKHMVQHRAKVKKAQCDLCGVRFYNANYVAAHMRRKHSIQRVEYECDECGFRSLNKPGLIMHLKHGHDSESNKVCRLCDKGFLRSSHLRQHYWVDHCVQIKKRNRRRRKKESEGTTVIKEEVDSAPEIDLLEIHKEELISDVEVDYQNGVGDEEYSKRVFGEDIARMIENADEEEKDAEKILNELMIGQHSRSNLEGNQSQAVVQVDTGLEESMRRELDTLVSSARREKEMVEMEETRRKYNERIRRAMDERPKKERITVKFLKNTKSNTADDGGSTVKYSIVNDGEPGGDGDGEELREGEGAGDDRETDSNDNEIDKDGGRGRRGRRVGKLRINTYQCYVCFKLFATKSKLTQHCQQHFDLCGDKMLKKCPMCDYVTNLNLKRHMRLVHGLHINVPHGTIKDSEDNTKGSRYYYDMGGDLNVQIIPSVRNLNKRACKKIDEKNREDKNLTVAKTKLVKKGTEWVVEKERVSVKDYILPEFDANNQIHCKMGESGYLAKNQMDSDDYLSKMKKLSRVAKANGTKMLFPCEDCPKICQTLSALKLHTRRHDPNAKPFKKKIWKHKIDGKETDRVGKVQKSKGRVADAKDSSAGVDGSGTVGKVATRRSQRNAVRNRERNEEKKGVEVAKKVSNKDEKVPNRHASPGPIVSRHRCDQSLREFYAQNVRGGDVQFHQFLKIYNRISREGATDDVAFGPEPTSGANKIPSGGAIGEGLRTSCLLAQGIPREGFNRYTRVVRISRREHLHRLEMKNKMRRELEARSSGT